MVCTVTHPRLCLRICLCLCPYGRLPYGSLWDMNRHQPVVGVPCSGRIALKPVSDTMMRSWFRIRMDLAFQPTLWILCEFGWRRD